LRASHLLNFRCMAMIKQTVRCEIFIDC